MYNESDQDSSHKLKGYPSLNPACVPLLPNSKIKSFNMIQESHLVKSIMGSGTFPDFVPANGNRRIISVTPK